MNATVRPERPSDYTAVASLNQGAFVHKNPSDCKAEPLFTSVLRYHERFDPALSLVAEADGRVMGTRCSRPLRSGCWGRSGRSGVSSDAEHRRLRTSRNRSPRA